MDLVKLAQQFISSNKNKKDAYIIAFNKEKDGYWYCDIPNWPGTHAQTMMVNGADTFLDCMNNGSNRVVLSVFLKDPHSEDFIKLIKLKSGLLEGADYRIIEHPELPSKLWICPVTLFVLGQYPSTLWIKNLTK